MATLNYTGSISSATGLNDSPSVSLTGSGSASGIISSVVARLQFSTNSYGTTYNVTATLNFSGGSVSATRSVKMNADNYSGATFDFTFPNLTVEQANSITSVRVSCSNNATKIFLKGAQSVAVEYKTIGNTLPPVTVTLSSTSVAPGAKVTLSWADAEAGTNNPITGYRIYRATKSGGEYSLLTTVSSTAQSGSTTVTAPTTDGASYYYRVETVGTYSGYDSDQTDPVALTCSFSTVGAPTAVRVDVTNVAPGVTATLSWSGAAAGANNAITGYEVHRATTADGDYSLLTTVAASATSASATVTAPENSGATYYYKVKTLGTLDGCDSALSTAYTSLTCTYSAPTAPAVKINGAAEAYVLPGEKATLSWSGATAGANNPVASYSIYRYQSHELLVSGIAPTVTSYQVPGPETPGEVYPVYVKACGLYSDSDYGAGCLIYTYTDPTAPTEVTVSEAEPAAGARVLLSWSGVEAGGWNNIVGYRVLRSDSVNGTYSLVTRVNSTDASGTIYVDAPATTGDVYYYRVETIGAHTGSGQSTAYASVTAGESAGADGEITVIVTPKERKKRGFILGDYDTAAEGWTLTGWSFAEPETQTNYIPVPGRSAGPLDASTALTGGDPRYGSRKLTITLECSEGTYLDREAGISYMTNRLHGQREEIIFPDDPARYVVGRISMERDYNDLAHAAVVVTAICEPWRYSQTETVLELTVTDDATDIMLSNDGRRQLVPEVTVTGYGAEVLLTCGGLTWVLHEGVHRLPDLILATGNTLLSYSGSGTLSIKYREAII